MDTMSITSKWTTQLISKMLKMLLKKKLGANNIEFDFRSIDAEVREEDIVVYISGCATIPKDDAMKLIFK